MGGWGKKILEKRGGKKKKKRGGGKLQLWKGLGVLTIRQTKAAFSFCASLYKSSLLP